ncbi:TraV family lipoprotein [Nostoc sp. CHAB 5834]|nr:TraV family lipoprotein [Nostoc sp. CHAB 5834]
MFEVRASAPAAQEKPFFNGESSNYPEPSQQGRPVFQQPKVMRVWVAPYVDADGNLRSGEYTYFNTPGKWNYGDMKKPGAASGAFEPGRPSNLGFNPVVKAPPEAKAPPKPAEQPAPAPAATSSANTKPSDASALAITQPYQRLNTK